MKDRSGLKVTDSNMKVVAIKNGTSGFMTFPIANQPLLCLLAGVHGWPGEKTALTAHSRIKTRTVHEPVRVLL